MSLFSSTDEHYSTPFVLNNRTNSRRGLIDKTCLEPENEYGNVEYKLRLTNPTPDRVERLVTQLKWRIREGHGEAFLFLGVKDNGVFIGLTPDDAELSLRTLEQMTAKIGARMSVVSEKFVDEPSDDLSMIQGSKAISRRCYKHKERNRKSSKSEQNNENVKAKKENQTQIYQQRKVLKVLIKEKTHEISEELRVAVLGPTESGKSTLLGVLSHGECDNGRGSARLNLFRHRHEIKSGHTSSISQEIFGLDQNGLPVTYSTCFSSEEIIEASLKIVSLIDLAGHQRYLNTTLFGLNSHSPDIVLLVVSCASQVTNTISDYISLVFGMEKLVVIIINKIDLVTAEIIENCYAGVTTLLHLIHPDISLMKITNMYDATQAASRLGTNIVPIFFTSCFTGAGISLLYKFFEQTSPSLTATNLNAAISESSEFQVDETFELPGTGTVVSGLVVCGIVREGDEMLIGPDDEGSFSRVTVNSLQRHKMPCNHVRAGQKCTLAITGKVVSVRRGMVLKEFDPNWSENFFVCWCFEARVKMIANKKRRLAAGSQVTVYVGNVKQTCDVISTEVAPTGELILILKLIKRPEYIRENSKIIVRDAQSKGIGYVQKIIQSK